MKKVLLLLVLFLFNFHITLNAQQDKLFYFAAPEISASAGDSPIFLRFLSYDTACIVTVNLPADGAFVPVVINLPANAVDSINLTPFLSSIESPAANIVSNNGIKITSTANISAFYELKSPTGREIFSLKGQKALGINFYTPFQRTFNNAATTPASFSSIDIVAKENNTSVLITPKTAIIGHAANVSFSITLNEGQTYSARDVNVSAASSLSGSIVSADKPISVTVFNGSLTNGACVDQVGDQITPTNYIGRDYVVRKGNGNNERIYILATQNNTSFTINDLTGSTTNVINWSETFDVNITDSIYYISSTKPIYIFHVSGSGCNLAGAQLPPLKCSGKSEVSFTRSSSDSLYGIFFIRSGYESQFTVNGNPAVINASNFAFVPGTSNEYVVAKINFSLTDVPVHSYNRVTNTGDIYGFGLTQGSATTGSGHAYFSDFISYPFINAGADDSICANVGFPINGIIGGGPIDGNWSTNGYGNFASASGNLSNTYIPSPLDSLVSPIRLILSSTGNCAVIKDTLMLFVTPAPIVNASVDQILCANNSDVQLNGNVQGGSTTGTWSSLGAGTFDDANNLDAIYTPSAAEISSGSSTLILESTNNGSCLAVTDTMMVTYTAGPTVDAGADTISVCSNNPSISLNGSVSGSSTTGKWITTGNGIFSPNNQALNATYQPSPADIASTQIFMILESTNNGNCIIVRDTALVLFTPSPVVDAGSSIVSCTNDAEFDLNGTVSGPTTTGIWSNGLGSYDVNNTDLTASYTPTAGEIGAASMILTLTSTNNGNCNAVSDNVQINFVAPPFANFNSTDECLTASSQFNDFSLPGFGTVNSWNYDFGDGNSSNVQNPSHTYSTPGNYDVSLIVTNTSGCSDTVVKDFDIFPLPVANFSYTSDCNNNQLFLNFQDMTASSDSVNYYFYDFGGQGSSTNENPTQLFTGFGNFTITHIVSTVNGCSDTSSQVIFVPQRPEAGFFYNAPSGLNVGAQFNFIDTSNFTNSLYWTFGDGNNSILTDPSNTYFANGTYTVTQYAYGEFGCIDSTSQQIVINTVTNEITTLIPNAISPNGDGKNDVWKLDFINILYPNAEIAVFNRWSQEIFRSTGYNTPWDGTFQGEKVPDGTYYYVIELNDSSVSQSLFKGAVLVLTSRD